MKFGMPSLAKYNSIKENIVFACNNDLDFIELNMDLPYCYKLNEISSNNNNIEFTMHLSEIINVGELNDYLRKAYVKEAIREIKLGLKHNITKFNLHINSGVYFTLPEGKFFLNEKFFDLYIHNLQKSCQELNDFALKNNIVINFENTKIFNFTPKAIELISSFSNLGFTLDIGHNEKNNNKAFPLLSKTNKINHIHMHDFDGKQDHIEIGLGNINFNKYCKLINKCYTVIEVKDDKELKNSIKYIKGNLL